MQIPADPDGTFGRVSGATIRVGIPANPPWTQIPESGTPSGSEVELIRCFDLSIDADVEWVHVGEEALMEKLDRGELDVDIGGLAAISPCPDPALHHRTLRIHGGGKGACLGSADGRERLPAQVGDNPPGCRY
ncbi:transporter substrate-binding domain-containing protein [Arthrobacter sp. Rue61a]|uniref:transporter substrate-binding domain-containing protein n=1 Tax=Arthrobacter sp. Rue61a TaxID=1118963 RepID=UPI00336A7A96